MGAGTRPRYPPAPDCTQTIPQPRPDGTIGGIALRCLIFEPGYTPYSASFRSGSEAVEKVIRADSRILLPFGNDIIALVCAEQQEEQPPNRTLEDGAVIRGRFFVCGYDGSALQGLTRKQADRYYRRYLYPEKFSSSGEGVISEIQYPRIKPADERIGKKSRAIER